MSVTARKAAIYFADRKPITIGNAEIVRFEDRMEFKLYDNLIAAYHFATKPEMLVINFQNYTTQTAKSYVNEVMQQFGLDGFHTRFKALMWTHHEVPANGDITFNLDLGEIVL